MPHMSSYPRPRPVLAQPPKLSCAPEPGGASWGVAGDSAGHEHGEPGRRDVQPEHLEQRDCSDSSDSTTLHMQDPVTNGPHMQIMQMAGTRDSRSRGRRDSPTPTHHPAHPHASGSPSSITDKSRTPTTRASTPPAAIDPKSARLQPAAACLSFSVLQILSVVSVVAVFILQFLLRGPEISFYHTSSSRQPAFSPLVDDIAPICANQPFPTSPPVSFPLTMALESKTKSVVSELEYTDDDVNVGVKEFLRQLNEGLETSGTSMSQIPTYVTAVPNGTEKGLYLAVDLGGTNLRVCSVRLNGDNTFNLTYSKAPVPKSLMVAKTAKELFAFIAQHIDAFIKEHHYDHYESHIRRRETMSTPEGYRDEHIFRLGFTFSFPVQQVGINKGFLIRWTKGFDIPDAVGKDVCALLQAEIDALRLPVKVAALVNDTVGTLMARSYTSPGKTGALLGGIFGTGTNGAYIEKLSNIKKTLEGDYDKTTGEMVINTEWGSFDNQLNVLPNTSYDIQLDRESVNPGIQMFEKRVSGMFLGEILRLILVSILQDKAVPLFQDDNSSHNDWKSTTTIGPASGIFRKWGLDSAIMSVAALDTTPDLGTLRQELDAQLDVYSPSLEDAQAFKAVADAVGRRAARLSAVAIGAVVLQSGSLTGAARDSSEPIDIGVDGSLVEHYPNFRTMIHEALKAIDGIGEKGADRIRIGIAKDGSGVGAALIALVAASMEKKQPTAAESLRNVRNEALIKSRKNLSAVDENAEREAEEAIDS